MPALAGTAGEAMSGLHLGPGPLGPPDPATGLPLMPPAAKLTANDCDEWLMQLIAHLARQVGAMGAAIKALSDRIDGNADAVTEAYNALAATVDTLEAAELARHNADVIADIKPGVADETL